MTIRYEQKGGVGVITLDRPKCLNAINFAMRDELTACLRTLATDLDTRVIVLSGAGRAFSAGLDLKEPEALRIGFVQALVEQESLLEEAAGLAKKLASKSPLGLRLTKEALDAAVAGLSLEQTIRLEDRNQAMCISQLVGASQ